LQKEEYARLFNDLFEQLKKHESQSWSWGGLSAWKYEKEYPQLPYIVLENINSFQNEFSKVLKAKTTIDML
jgi:hypothetical protein